MRRILAFALTMLIMTGCNDLNGDIPSETVNPKSEVSTEEAKPATSYKESNPYPDASSESSSDASSEDTDLLTDGTTTNSDVESPTTNTPEISDKEQELSVKNNDIENANTASNPSEPTSEQSQPRPRPSGISNELSEAANAIENALNSSDYGGLYYEKDGENATTSILIVAVLDEAVTREKLENVFQNQLDISQIKYKQVEYSLGTLEAVQSNLWENYEKYGIQSCGISVQRNRCTVALQSKEISNELRSFLDTYMNAGCVEITYNNEVIENT